MTTSYEGGCACAAIRYAAAGEPVFSNHCQCRDCQRESGTGHGSYLTFHRAGMTFTGKPATWAMTADSGSVKTRHFCDRCGVAVYLTFAGMPDLVAVRAGSLDDPGRFTPHAVTYAGRAWPWDHVDPALARFERMPEA